MTQQKANRPKNPPKWIKKDDTFQTQYHGVCRYVHPHHGFVWFSARCGKTYESFHDTELAAAKAVDRVLISRGKSPVNVFKPKTSDLSDFDSDVVSTYQNEKKVS